MQRTPFLVLALLTSLVVVALSACGGDGSSSKGALEATVEAAVQATKDASLTPDSVASSTQPFVTSPAVTPTPAPTTTPLFQPSGEDVFSARVEESNWSQVGNLTRLRVTYVVRNHGEEPLNGGSFFLRAVDDEGSAGFPSTNLLPNIGASGSYRGNQTFEFDSTPAEVTFFVTYVQPRGPAATTFFPISGPTAP